jgi:hypothetical protein
MTLRERDRTGFIRRYAVDGVSAIAKMQEEAP